MRTKRLEKDCLDAEQKAIEMEKARAQQIDEERQARARREAEFRRREDELLKTNKENLKRVEQEHKERLEDLAKEMNAEIEKRQREREAALQEEQQRLEKEYEELKVKAKYIGNHNDKNPLNQEQTWQNELEKTKKIKKGCLVSKLLALYLETKCGSVRTCTNPVIA